MSSAEPISPQVREHIAVYPGSFDPVTFGHLDVIRRGRHLFDRLIVAVGRNPGKDPLFSTEERLEMIRELVAQMQREEAAAGRPRPQVDVEAFSGLTVDFARSRGATILLKGIRNLSDLQTEIQQALTNREVAGLETAFIAAGQDFGYTSSSLIRQITALGSDLSALSSMVPPTVIERLRRKKAEKHPALERLRAAQSAE